MTAHDAHTGTEGQWVALTEKRLAGVDFCDVAERLAAVGEQPDAAHVRACPVCLRRERVTEAGKIIRCARWTVISRSRVNALLESFAETFFDDPDQDDPATYWGFYAALAAHPDLEEEFALFIVATQVPIEVVPPPPALPWWRAAELLEESLNRFAADRCATLVPTRARINQNLAYAEALALRFRVWGEEPDRERAKELLREIAAAGFSDDRVLAAVQRIDARMRPPDAESQGRWTQEDLDRVLSLHARAQREATG